MAKRNPETIDGGSYPINSRFFRNGDNGSDSISNNQAQFIEFFHLPSAYFVSFKAFLTEFLDSYTSEWNTQQVYGRMDPIATFKRTSRKISVGFQVPANSFQEAEQNMTRMSLLIQMLYPSFEASPLSKMESAAPGEPKTSDTISTIKGSPLFKIKFLNWIKGTSEASMKSESGQVEGENMVGFDAQSAGLMGFIEGFAFAPDLEAGVFQAGLEIYPKLMTVSFVFNVLHEHELGWKESSDHKGLTAAPLRPRFPYGKSTRFKDREQSKQEKKQGDRFLELQKAQLKILMK